MYDNLPSKRLSADFGISCVMTLPILKPTDAVKRRLSAKIP